MTTDQDEAQKAIDRLHEETLRLSSWLLKIAGGDNPCRDEGQLRQWAYDAVILGKDCE